MDNVHRGDTIWYKKQRQAHTNSHKRQMAPSEVHARRRPFIIIAKAAPKRRTAAHTAAALPAAALPAAAHTAVWRLPANGMVVIEAGRALHIRVGAGTYGVVPSAGRHAGR